MGHLGLLEMTQQVSLVHELASTGAVSSQPKRLDTLMIRSYGKVCDGLEPRSTVYVRLLKSARVHECQKIKIKIM